MPEGLTQSQQNLVEVLAKNGIKVSTDTVKTATDAAMNIQTDAANDVEHTANVGFGKELVEEETLSAKMIDLIPKYSNLIALLPGRHPDGVFGQAVNLMGEIGFFEGDAEWKDEPETVKRGTTKVPTGKIIIRQSSLSIAIPLSRQILNYSIVNLEKYVLNKIAKSAARTIDSMIINGDDTTGTANINGALGATDHRMMVTSPGLRATALNSGVASDVMAIGTPSWADIVDMMKLFEHDAEDLLFIIPRKVHLELMKLDEYKNQYVNGVSSTVPGLNLSTLSGVPVHIARDIPLTDATGVVSATATDNTKGIMILCERSCVQYGYGQELEIEVDHVFLSGKRIGGTFDFGHKIVQREVGATAPRVVMGVDIAV